MVREAKADPRTVHELVALALSRPDEDPGWEAVSILHRRGSREAFEVGRGLCRSPCPVERTLGANILGQLGVPDRTYPAESVAVLRDLIQTESDIAVLQATCIAIGHQHDRRAIPDVARLATHPHEDVRFGVAVALQGFADPLAIATLIGLTADPDADVRDWATFALGTQTDVDTPAVRDALLNRTADPEDMVRGEALVGLARRRDGRVVGPLIRELVATAASDHGRLPVEAAEELGDARLLPTLERLNAGNTDGRYDEAIRRCSRPAASGLNDVSSVREDGPR